MNALPWFRAYTDMVDDEKLRLLAFEDRWHFVALLCCKGSGLLDGDDTPAMLRRKVGVKLGLAARELEAMAERLAELGLIDADTFQPAAWGDRQFKSDNSLERVRAFRAKQKEVCNVTVTAQETDTDKEKTKKKAPPPRVSKAKPELTYSAWSASLTEGQRAMPANHAVFKYADKIGLPLDFLRLAWLEFRRKHTDGSGKDKRQKDWRQTFQNYVEGNYFKLWFLDNGEYRLTTVGAQAQKLHGAD